MRDCWRRCVAQLLGMEAEQVPDFVNDDPEYWLPDTNEWLEGFGKQLVVLVSMKEQQTVQMAKLVESKAAHIAVGIMADGHAHAVVVGADGQVWDPMANGSKLQLVNAMYWVVDG